MCMSLCWIWHNVTEQDKKCSKWPAGPSLRFHVDTIVAVTGANFEADVDGSSVHLWESILMKSGSVLTVGKVQHAVKFLSSHPCIMWRLC